MIAGIKEAGEAMVTLVSDPISKLDTLFHLARGTHKVVKALDDK